MSHTSVIKAIQIASITALSAAISELAASGVAISLAQNAVPRAYFDNQAGMDKPAPYVIKLANSPYDIGLYLSEDGKTYEPRTDLYGGHIAREIGGKATTPERREQAQMGKLFQMYATHVVMEQARMKGQSVRRITDTNTGKITLEITGSNL